MTRVSTLARCLGKVSEAAERQIVRGLFSSLCIFSAKNGVIWIWLIKEIFRNYQNWAVTYPLRIGIDMFVAIPGKSFFPDLH
jgi:lauroyl/myristoyl acyltransferase